MLFSPELFQQSVHGVGVVGAGVVGGVAWWCSVAAGSPVLRHGPRHAGGRGGEGAGRGVAVEVHVPIAVPPAAHGEGGGAAREGVAYQGSG